MFSGIYLVKQILGSQLSNSSKFILCSQDKIIGKLLNDEFFIRWLNNESERDERKKWNNWKNESKTHQVITEKAKKFISMPFTEKTCTDEPGELKRLMKNLKNLREEVTNLNLN